MQWKVDWAMRWFTFDVDFEMYGKDLTESAILSNKFARHLENPPNGFAYEFLDEKERKFQNQKEMEFIDQSLDTHHQRVSYMYPNPKRAKKLTQRLCQNS